jgi:hypothetical protein
MSQTSDSASNSDASGTLAGNGVATSNLLDALYQYDALSRHTRHYVLSDTMLSTTALSTTDATIQQRLRYSAFGTPTFTDKCDCEDERIIFFVRKLPDWENSKCPATWSCRWKVGDWKGNFHATKGPNGCSDGQWREVDGFTKKEKPDEFQPVKKEDDDEIIRNNKYCCCRSVNSPKQKMRKIPQKNIFFTLGYRRDFSFYFMLA